MLKLNHKAMRRTNISDVLFPGLPIVLDKLLAFGRKVVFPRAVPVGFLFGPGITIPDSCTAQNGFLSDHLVGASVRGLIRATPLSEDHQRTVHCRLANQHCLPTPVARRIWIG
jgi:hypothetical protein